MEALSETEILSAFSELEDDIDLPDLAEVDWSTLEYFGWIHPGGHRGYMVVISPDDGSVVGVTLRRSRSPSAQNGFEMCSLCNHVHRANGTALFTINCKDSERRHTYGNMVCKDLDCSLRIRNLVEPASYLNETLYTERKIWRMQLALHKWLRTAHHL